MNRAVVGWLCVSGACLGLACRGSSGGSSTGPGPRSTATPESGDGTGSGPCPGNGQPCVILPLGDSITNGFTYPGGYRIELFRKARADGKRITFMGSQVSGPETVDGAIFPRQHEGHDGITIADLGAQWVPNPDTNDVPHIVLLMIGTNDIYERLDVANAPRRLGALIDRVTSAYPRALLVVATLTPMSDEVPARPVEAYNAAIQPVVEGRAAAGKPIELVDMYGGFPADGLSDVVHPNAVGFGHMARVWYAAIGNLLR
jgi:hypothetical protein